MTDINEIFEQGGLLQQKLEGYESRPQQTRMARVVNTTIRDKKIAIIEAPTGVGKGFAYLVPVILQGKKAVVSTSNKNLQDQLNSKDLPTLKKILGIDFTWAVLKGKSNYFCYEQFSINQKELKELLSTREIKAIKHWADSDETGDLDYFPGQLTPQVRELIAHDPENKHERGSNFADLCFASRARIRARESQIILVNHTLLTLDIATKIQTEGKRGLLPKVNVIIVDEAHALEKYASMAFSEEITKWSLKHFLDWTMVKNSITYKAKNKLMDDFESALQKYLPDKPDGYYYKPKRVNQFEGFDLVIAQIEKVIEKVEGNSRIGKDEASNVKRQKIIKEGENLIGKIQSFTKEDENYVFWTEAYDGRRGVTIKMMSAPISVGGLLGAYFNKRCAVFTSATLSANGSFEFFKDQIGLTGKPFELIEQSPFDFENNSMAYIADGQQDKIKEVEELLKCSKGRAFVLFTSYRDMFIFYENVDVPYKKLVQAKGISKHQLLTEFKESENAVLFATRSFWEGVDIRGEKLSMVIIHKIPFANPSDLIYQSKQEQIDKKYNQKGASWIRYTIPDAVLALKQGFGRLIRSTTDKGLYVLLDERITYANYGKAILTAFPLATPRTQKLERVKAFFDRIAH